MNNNHGFTLIEIIMFVVIGAIFLPASLIAFNSVISNYSRPDYYVKARFYAEQRMYGITNRLYDDIVSPCASTPDGGDGYTTECTVETINADDLSTTSPSAYYKRVTVTVKNIDAAVNYSVTSIVTRRPKK